MKRVDLIRHIEANGFAFLREGGRHRVYFNLNSRKVSTSPRHREINDFMAKKICRELEITEPGKQKKSDQGDKAMQRTCDKIECDGLSKVASR